MRPWRWLYVLPIRLRSLFRRMSKMIWPFVRAHHVSRVDPMTALRCE